MKTRSRSAYLMWGYMLIIFSTALQAQQLSERKIRHSVVRIQVSDAEVGTGFVFHTSAEDESPIGYIMTAYHVVEEWAFTDEPIKVWFESDPKTYHAKVHRIEDHIDLAILVMEEPPKRLEQLLLGEVEGTEAGTAVYIYGYPGGGRLTRDGGTISYLSGNRIGLDDIEPNKGNSGGPLLCEATAQVLGIIVQKSIDPTDQYAVKISTIITYIENEDEFRPAIRNPLRRPCTEITDSERGLGVRVGFFHHYEKPIYAGVSNSFYLEGYLAYKLFGSPTLYMGIEPTFGVDVVQQFGLIRGVKAFNFFINIEAVLSGERYNIPLKASIGTGLGLLGIHFYYHDGDDDYDKNCSKRETDSDIDGPTATLYGKLEFPLPGNLRFHVLLRQVFQSQELKISDISYSEDNCYSPAGKLGGFAIVGGLEFDLH